MNYFDLLAAKTLSGGGVEPTGTLDITANGSYDVAQYANANVNVPTGGGDSVLTDLIERDIASIIIPSGTTKIGDSIFNECTSLASVTIPNSVASIDDYAFQRCTSLASVTIPNGVTRIGNSAFSNCSSLTSAMIPDGVTSIGSGAFYGCTSLASVTIPNGVTRIGATTFGGCTSLASITVKAATPPTLAANAFLNVPATANIYVPPESVEAYKAASNWSARAAYIQAIPSA